MPSEPQNREPVVVERVQTGVRMEKRMLKVLKALAEQKDMTWATCWKESSCTLSKARSSHSLRKRSRKSNNSRLSTE